MHTPSLTQFFPIIPRFMFYWHVDATFAQVLRNSRTTSSRLARPLTQIQPSIDFSCNPVSHNCIPGLHYVHTFHSIALWIVSLCFLTLSFSLVYSVKKNHFQWIVAGRSDIVIVRKETCVFSRVSISLKENWGITIIISFKGDVWKFQGKRKISVVFN